MPAAASGSPRLMASKTRRCSSASLEKSTPDLLTGVLLQGKARVQEISDEVAEA